MKKKQKTVTFPGIQKISGILALSVFLFLFFSLTSCNGDTKTGEKASEETKEVFDYNSIVSDSSGWTQLFNGEDLTGWKHVGWGSMSVEDGMIRGHGGMGLLYWPAEMFGNCALRVEFKMEKTNSNSGVFIRIPIEPFEEWMPVYYGAEIQIDNMPELSGEDEYHYTGTIYSLTKPIEKTGKPGPEWNKMLIIMDAQRTLVFLNDKLVTDYTDGDPVPERAFDFEPYRGPRPEYGYIGLQNHGEADVVFFRKVEVKSLRNFRHENE